MKRALYNFAGKTMIVLLFVPVLYTLDLVAWVIVGQPLRVGLAGSTRVIRESWGRF